MKLRGLDLFSGIGGLSESLKEWVNPTTFCESDAYARAVLLSRMRFGEINPAPIWDDVRTLHPGRDWYDIVYGGFPCQDLSAAGLGRGLAGERSGLYFELERIVREAAPTFIFLENVPAIRTRGLGRVVWGLSEFGYDLRWTVVSAAEVGAPHLRKRWFLLAYRHGDGRQEFEKRDGQKSQSEGQLGHNLDRLHNPMADAYRQRGGEGGCVTTLRQWRHDPVVGSKWSTEPDVGRVAHGVSFRVDRLRCLGNAVVPEQAKTAFKRLMGLR